MFAGHHLSSTPTTRRHRRRDAQGEDGTGTAGSSERANRRGGLHHGDAVVGAGHVALAAASSACAIAQTEGGGFEARRPLLEEPCSCGAFSFPRSLSQRALLGSGHVAECLVTNSLANAALSSWCGRRRSLIAACLAHEDRPCRGVRGRLLLSCAKEEQTAATPSPAARGHASAPGPECAFCSQPRFYGGASARDRAADAHAPTVSPLPTRRYPRERTVSPGWSAPVGQALSARREGEVGCGARLVACSVGRSCT
jgi:hypothetical protein